jgi:hypothetical protein
MLSLGVFPLAWCLYGARPVQANEELYARVASSTALIYTGGGSPVLSTGTGFLIDTSRRLVITARHVVQNLDGGIAPGIVVVFAQTRDGEIITEASYYRKNRQKLGLPGKVVYESVRRDMAVIELEKLPAGIKALELASQRARPGQTVHVIGNSSEHFGGVFSYCKGAVRNAFHWEDLGARVVATQVPTNKGDSGGPTVNERGEVVGFACWSTTGGPQPKNSSFHDLQVTGLSVCVSEIRQGLQEMRDRLAGLDKARDSQIFRGNTRTCTHYVLMEKDVLYRIFIKTQGFVPDVRLDGNLVYGGTTGTRVPGGDWQHLFTPRETKQYRIQVSYLPGSDIGKGSFPYTLGVDQVSFAAEATIKEPQLRLNEHVHKLEMGKVYRLTVRGKGFEPDVKLLDGSKTVVYRANYGKRANTGAGLDFFEAVGLARPEFETSLIFVPLKTTSYRIMIDVSPFSQPGNDRLAYTMHIAEQKARLSVSGQLSAKDPLYPKGGPFHVHPVKLEGGKTYQIDLLTSAFDSRLLLEDASGKVVMEGFDADGFNGQLVFRPGKTDTFRVVATAYQNNAQGPYLLTVVENPEAQARMPRFDKNPFPGGP